MGELINRVCYLRKVIIWMRMWQLIIGESSTEYASFSLISRYVKQKEMCYLGLCIFWIGNQTAQIALIFNQLHSKHFGWTCWFYSYSSIQKKAPPTEWQVGCLSLLSEGFLRSGFTPSPIYKTIQTTIAQDAQHEERNKDDYVDNLIGSSKLGCHCIQIPYAQIIRGLQGWGISLY